MGLAEMLEGIQGLSKKDAQPVARCERDFAKGFSPVPDLKVGDRLRWKSEEHRVNKWPTLTEEVEVYSVSVPETTRDGGNPIDRNDFSVLFYGDGFIMEFAYDSRRFERVE